MSFRALGFATYRAYLASPHWRAVKRLYRESDLPQECVLCGAEENVHLHHKTYVRIGNERLTDLAPLCARCHSMVHVLASRNQIGIDLVGLTSDARAEMYREQGAAMLERALTENNQPRELSVLDKAQLGPLLKRIHNREPTVRLIRERKLVGRKTQRELGRPERDRKRAERQQARADRTAAEHAAAEQYVQTGQRSFTA